MFFSLIEEINRLISKGMSNIHYWEKLTFSKVRFSRKENLKKCTSFEKQKGAGYIREKALFWHYRLQLSCVYKSVSQISFYLFCSRDKRLLSEFLRKWGWFQGHNERFPKYLGQKSNFQKTVTRFCRWKSNDDNDSIVFLSLENRCNSLFAKEKTWKSIINTNSKLSQNCKNKLCHPKQQQIVYLMTYDLI